MKSCLVAAGAPCVGFSEAKDDPQGTFDPASALVAILPTLLGLLNELLPESVAIFFYLENVRMEEPASILRCQELLTACLQVPSTLLDGTLISASSRKRRIWTNLHLEPLRAVGVDTTACLQDGWIPLWEFPSGTPRPDLRFGTFTRGFAPGFPHEVPAQYKSFPRMGLHAYHDRLLVYRPGAPSALLQQLREKVQTSVRIKTKTLRHPDSPALLARAKLASWIHREGGDQVLRPPSGSERDVIMGFPAGASSLPSDPDSNFVLAQMEATGNTFLVPMISHVLHHYAAFVHSPTQPPANPFVSGWSRQHLPPRRSFQDNLKLLQPSGSGGAPH